MSSSLFRRLIAAALALVVLTLLAINYVLVLSPRVPELRLTLIFALRFSQSRFSRRSWHSQSLYPFRGR